MNIMSEQKQTQKPNTEANKNKPKENSKKCKGNKKRDCK